MHNKKFLEEREQLRFLCARNLSVEQRAKLCGEWKPEQFMDDIHRVILEEIIKLGTVGADQLRELLPARLTNRGFPEVEMEEYFSQ